MADRSRKWICDASPLILLAKVGCADLLSVLPDKLIVPEAVAREVAAGSVDSPARKWIRENRQRFVRTTGSEVPAIASWDLGPGESAVLSIAHERSGWTVVIDDLAGRRCAEALGISVTGTVGVVLLAKEEERITEARPVLEKLVRKGLRASDSLLKEALRLAGES